MPEQPNDFHFGGHLEPHPSPLQDLLDKGWKFVFDETTGCVHGVAKVGSRQTILRVFSRRPGLGQTIAAFLNGGQK